MSQLVIQAGPDAYAKIQRDGLQAEDIAAVFGASGAAKWLGIYGLDSAIFSQWLVTAKQKIFLYGTSVGAFKLAAAAQCDSALAFKRLADGYIAQDYSKDFSTAAIARETQRIIDKVLPDEAVTQVLNSEKYLFGCGAVQCTGLLGSESLMQQRLGMVRATVQNALPWMGRPEFTRVICAGEAARPLIKLDAGRFISLQEDTFKSAILASGSLPVYMSGVRGLDGQVDAVYRDGGLLDYHPIPRNLLSDHTGLVLYPHFYPHLVEQWFDKFYPWRKVSADRLANVVLISPSESFVQTLPQQRIPDRKDFSLYRGRDQQRIALWQRAAEQSFELGEAFLSLQKTGDIARMVKPLPV